MLKIEIWNIAFTIINLLVLFVAFRLVLFKPVQRIIAKRQEEADEEYEEAKQAKAEAMDLKAQYEESLENAQAESKKTIQEARKTADQEYQRIVGSAEEAAKQLKEDAEKQAESRKEQILKKAEKEIADMVVDAAGKMAGSKSGAEFDRALYDEFLNKAGDEA